ncbi:hypothetical protein QBC47DRAFT_92431 [Echria macrotheca]|uniref:RNase MRP protein 1 RNA binding domain-containing protein n=1 Tax=Echria macrotheca TaxID=438768 RepID=A0AAJ0F4U4_9PEZI|nr:hypothetical protein QBC47DRAFT_92431 [Echria macrotheca]
MKEQTDPQTLSKTLASLTPTLEILARFHHRNRNQLRVAKWWAELDMLRRQLKKFSEAVEGRLVLVEKRGVKGAVAVLAKERKGKKGNGDREVEDEICVRGRYLRDVLGPRCYLAFSQLTADRRFAHMGLMLLAVLAQIDAATAVYAPSPPSSLPSSSTPIPDAESASNPLSEPTNIPAQVLDIGEAVSREEVSQLFQGDIDVDTPDRSVSKMDGTRAEELVSSSSSSSRPAEEPPKKVRGKKRRGGGGDGDEFDDIFSSLAPPTSSSSGLSSLKTKKSRKGDEDEFDDIFASIESPDPVKPPKKKKGKGKAVDESDSFFAPAPALVPDPVTVTVPTPTPAPTPATTSKPSTDTSSSQPRQQHPSKSKQKPKKTPDEFDTIFGTLDKKPPQNKKKKKRRGGDEFDDIFAGL